VIALDIRFALRVLARRPGVPLVLAGLFALSIGLASGMWAVIDAVALRPLPYRDDRQLVAVMEQHPERGMMAVTPANFLDWKDRASALQDATALGGLEASVVAQGSAVRAIGTKVTDRFFDLLGVTPALGRGLAAADFRSDSRVAVIGHGLWSRTFGSNPNIVGAPIVIDGDAYTVVGVMPSSFKTIGKSEVWIPWLMSPAEQSERRFHLAGVMARLRPGRTASDAQQELAALYRQLQADHADTTTNWSARVLPLRDLILGDSRRSLFMLGATIVVLIIVASINIAGLLLAWLPTRRQEFVVRLALGARVSRVVGQLLAETLIWGLAGLAGGLLLALSFVHLFGAVGISPALEYDFEPRIDARSLLAMALLLVVNIGVTALIPSIVSVRRSRDLVPRGARATQVLGRRLAIVVQVALSVLLLCATGALLAGFNSVSRAAARGPRAGFVVEVSLAEARYREEASQRQFFDRLLSALTTRPEVRSVGAATYVPPARIFGNVRFAIEGRSTATDALTALVSGVSQSAFTVLGIPLVRGRLIDERDQPQAPRAGVISAALARRYWAAEDPIGHRISLVGDPAPITIVGIVDDVRQPLSVDPRAEAVLYLPYRQMPWPFMSVLVVPAGDMAPAVAAVREEVGRIDSTQAVGAAQMIDEIRNQWLEQPRLQTRIVALFGVSTLLLTLVGLYARVAYAAASRTREFAIRQALGARPADVVRLLTGEAVAVVLAGALAGMACLPAAAASIQSVVGPSARTDLTLASAIAALFSVLAFASAYWPARRAGQTDPAQLLRAE
jgi:putative ABC transport system permease protein